MTYEPNILSVGYHKGEMDFGVNASIKDLTYEQMKNFREMVVVAIGIAESMWREANSPKAGILPPDNTK